MGVVRKLLLLAVVVALASKALPGGDGSSGEAIASAQAPTVTQQTAAYQANGWEYHDPTDDMTGKKYKYVRIKSDNSLSLGRPYDGANYGTLAVRQHPQHGMDVVVSIDKGQILCRGSSYWDCEFKIRFDDGPVEKFSALRAADGSSTVIFAKYPKWAVGKLKAAKAVKVQLLVYKAGEQTLTFSMNEPLKW